MSNTSNLVICWVLKIWSVSDIKFKIDRTGKI